MPRTLAPRPTSSEKSLSHQHLEALAKGTGWPMDSPLRPAREILGVSVKAMAAVLKVEPNTIGLWERGQMRPKLSRVPAIARAYGLGQDVVWAWATEHVRNDGLADDAEDARSPVPEALDHEARIAALERLVQEVSARQGMLSDGYEALFTLCEEVRNALRNEGAT